ncbi:MAG: alpha/beta hydrolase [Actinobacteria bacterium]|nr:alpha/beta hydrolase [Actinomycetota bacterium]
MPYALLDGISTRYEVSGSGPALLMLSPGGFDATIEGWSSLGIYRRLGLLDRLAERYTCIRFDRRDAGGSGGRVERIGWGHYARQAKTLLDALGIESAHLIGGCVGCSTAVALAVDQPARVTSMVLYSPAGGAAYRIKQHARFAEHLGYVAQHGLEAVARLARTNDQGFSQDARVGPWVSVLRRDQAFAADYAALDPDRYAVVVTGMARLLFDRDTVPGAEPEDMMLLNIPALIVPGQDSSHATSAARYLQECLPRAEYWDVPVPAQTAQNAPSRVLQFLANVDRGVAPQP